MFQVKGSTWRSQLTLTVQLHKRWKKPRNFNSQEIKEQEFKSLCFGVRNHKTPVSASADTEYNYMKVTASISEGSIKI